MTKTGTIKEALAVARTASKVQRGAVPPSHERLGSEMAAAKTAAQRKADERQRHKAAGRVAVTVHVRPDYVPEVRAHEAKLRRREKRT